MARKIIQIAFETEGSIGQEYDHVYEERSTGGSITSELHALCDDGTIWFFRNDKWNRWELPTIPQDDLAAKEA